MDFSEILTHFMTLFLGGAIGSFLTFKIVKKSNTQNNNTIRDGNIINGNYNNGNNNTNKNHNE